MSPLLMPLPALFLTLIVAFIERSQEVRGIPPKQRGASLDGLNLAVALSVLGTAALLHLALLRAILALKEIEDLDTLTRNLDSLSQDFSGLIYATIVTWAVLTRIGFGPWVMRRLIKGPPSSSKPTT